VVVVEELFGTTADSVGAMLVVVVAVPGGVGAAAPVDVLAVGDKKLIVVGAGSVPLPLVLLAPVAAVTIPVFWSGAVADVSVEDGPALVVIDDDENEPFLAGDDCAVGAIGTGAADAGGGGGGGGGLRQSIANNISVCSLSNSLIDASFLTKSTTATRSRSNSRYQSQTNTNVSKEFLFVKSQKQHHRTIL
jgi:hypothetical protein